MLVSTAEIQERSIRAPLVAFLYDYFPIQVVALNESVPGSVKSVFKPWEQRLETSGVCTSANIDG